MEGRVGVPERDGDAVVYELGDAREDSGNLGGERDAFYRARWGQKIVGAVAGGERREAGWRGEEKGRVVDAFFEGVEEGAFAVRSEGLGAVGGIAAGA